MFEINARNLWMSGMVLLLSACATGKVPEGVNMNDWVEYKKRFVVSDGRVVDEGQGGISHSEGQAYAMLFAVAFNDRSTFERVWEWSRTHLARPDGLFAWKWNPQFGRVTDTNNATDGDLGIAWALMRAAQRWDVPEYRAEAMRILSAMKKLEVEIGGFRVLLPGERGFRRGKGAMLNPSYWVLPAYRELAQLGAKDAPNWARIQEDARRLLRAARFGVWGLPADWVDLRGTGEVRVARTRKPVFGYDAMRVPLYLAWAGERELLLPYLRFWDEFTMRTLVPDRVNLATDEVHLAPRPQAVRDIAILCRRAVGRKVQLGPIDWSQNPGYYDASLRLLVRLAWQELRAEGR